MVKGPSFIEHQVHYCHITSFMFLSAHILSGELDEKDSVEINHIHVSASVIDLTFPNPLALAQHWICLWQSLLSWVTELVA